MSSEKPRLCQTCAVYIIRLNGVLEFVKIKWSLSIKIWFLSEMDNKCGALIDVSMQRIHFFVKVGPRR